MRPAERSGHAPPPTLANPHVPPAPASGSVGASQTWLEGLCNAGGSWLLGGGCAGGLLLPIHQRQQHLLHPSPPHRREGHVLHIVPHSLPPKVYQGTHPSELLAHLVHSRLFGRQPMVFD